MQNFSRKHRLALNTKINHDNFRLGLEPIFGKSELFYRFAENEARCRHRHREFRKALKKGGIL